jgi:2-phosphosulfolactate phosphatase
MNIEIFHLLEGARRASGLTVIIDVFRAFSTACYVFARGASRIIPVGDLDLAYALKMKNPDSLLIGERKGQKPAGFDYGNSPTDIEAVDFTNRTVIQTTSAGTQGIANALSADAIITGSFVNAKAIVSYIRSKAPDQVSLVCMGHEAIEPSDEDTLCAEFIRDSLSGKKTDFELIHARLRKCHAAEKFFDPEKTWAPERDFDLCLDLDRFNFVLVIKTDMDGLLYLQKVDVQ